MALRQQATSLGGLPIQIDYTARDFNSIRSELLKLTEILTPEWTDKQPGDIGVTILEAVAYVADILSYTLDRDMNESYLATAQTRESVVNLLRLIGYELQPASPATVSMVIRTTIDDVVLPEGFKVRTEGNSFSESLEYELPNAVALGQAGYHCVPTEAAKCLRVFNSPPTTNNGLVFVAGEKIGLELLGTSNGKVDQIFILQKNPICLNADDSSSIQVFINNQEWALKTSFVGAEANSQIFVFKVSATQVGTIEFGDGVTGAIPPNNVDIFCSYRINGGFVTNRAGVGSISQFDSVNGVSYVYNLEQPSGGSDPESIDNAKKQAPLSLRALDRCVTLGDFETLALKVPGGGLRSAKAVKGNSPIEVIVYVASEGDNPIPSGRWYSNIQNGFGMIGSVGRWLGTKKPVPTILKVERPTVVRPYLEANIYLYNNVIKQSVLYRVDTVLQQLFTRATNDFGDGVTLSSVVQVIENTQGVDYLDVVAFHRIPETRFITGNEASYEASIVEISNIKRQLEKSVYRIVWSNHSSFKLQKDGIFLKGLDDQEQSFEVQQVNNIVIYLKDTAANEASQREQFTLEVTVGSPVPVAGDIWEFSVDNFLSNIETMPYEIIVSSTQSDGLLNTEEISLTFIGGIG